MNFMPYESIIINTSLHLKDVKSILLQATSSNDTFGKFTGHISDFRFRIRRITWYANAFLPILYGVLCEDPNGVRIHIKMMPQRSSIPFIIFWYGSASYILISSIIMWINTGLFSLKILFALGMILFLYLVIML